jgi:NAD-dependent SIR2 family protein deacetylase
MDPIKQLATDLHNNRGPVLVVTGAGISLASGIPTFRGTDPGAVWKKDVTELGTVRYFYDEPEGSWSWYLQRFGALHNAQPNPGHTALAALEDWCDSKQMPFLLITQNVDGLHAAAGSRKLIEVHGAARRVRCSKYGCSLGAPNGSIARVDVEAKIQEFLANPIRENVPRCPKCDSFLRQHVLWFDEYYDEHSDYHWKQVLQSSEEAKLVIFIGTSFSVGVTELVVSAARKHRAPIYNIDPAGSDARSITLIKEGSEKALPALMTELQNWF